MKAAPYRLIASIVGLLAILLPATALAAGGGQLTVATNAEIQSLDPHFAVAHIDGYIQGTVFDGLTQFDHDMLEVPNLAESWDLEDGGATYVFHLRPGVTFHDGSALDAADVVYSYDRIIHQEPRTKWVNYLGGVESIEAVDDLTVRIELAAPNAAFLSNLVFLAIVPEGSGDTLATNPVGTGPFVFVERVPGERIVLRKNADYWDTSAELADELIFVPNPDASTKIANLRTGVVQMADMIPYANIETLRSDASVYLASPALSSGYYHIMLNNARAPFDNQKLREAFAYATNKEAMVGIVTMGVSNVSSAPFDSQHWAYSPEVDAEYGYEFDLDRAKELLAEAGYPDGLTVAAKVPPAYPDMVQMIEILANDLRQIGVTLEIQQLEWSTFLQQVWADRDFDVSINISSREYDPDSLWRTPFYSTGGSNVVGYQSADMDAALDGGAAALTQEERKSFYAEAQRLLLTDVPQILVANYKVSWGAQNSVKGLSVNTKGYPDWRHLWVE